VREIFLTSADFRDVKPGILVAIFTNTFAKGPKVKSVTNATNNKPVQLF